MLKLYTVAEYAKKKKITRVAVWQKVKAKKLNAIRIAPKLHLIATS